MLVCMTWQHTFETISFSVYPFQDLKGLWSSTRIPSDTGHFQGAASLSSDNQLVWVIYRRRELLLLCPRRSIRADPFCIHHSLLWLSMREKVEHQNRKCPTNSAIRRSVQGFDMRFQSPVRTECRTVSRLSPNRNVIPNQVGTGSGVMVVAGSSNSRASGAQRFSHVVL